MLYIFPTYVIKYYHLCEKLKTSGIKHENLKAYKSMGKEVVDRLELSQNA